MEISLRELEIVFGPESKGNTLEERARTSTVRWVRGQVQFGVDSPRATGLRMSSVEALEIFGWDSLLETVDFDSAVIPWSHEEPSQTLRARREWLGLTREDVARLTGLSLQLVERAEDPKCASLMADLEKICEVLGLDPRWLGRASKLAPGWEPGQKSKKT